MVARSAQGQAGNPPQLTWPEERSLAEADCRQKVESACTPQLTHPGFTNMFLGVEHRVHVATPPISSAKTKSVAQRTNIAIDYWDRKMEHRPCKHPWGKFKQCPVPPGSCCA